MTSFPARAFLCVFLLIPASRAASAAGAPCDRACLKAALDQYLNAIVKHDPSSAPLFVAFRQTDNAIVVRPGTGVWKSITALGPLERRYFDPVSGQAGFFGIVEESGERGVATLRLKVEDRKITEAEWIIARKGEWGPNGPGGNALNIDSLMANPPMERVVPKDARMPRETMVAVTNSYFDGLSTHDGSIILHETGCTRVENGTVMTGRGRGAGPARGAGADGRGGRAGAAAAPPGGSDCASNLENLNMALVSARRYPIVDEEAGVVLGLVVFVRKPGTATRRNLLSEWFFLDNNRVRTIYAAMFYPPPDAPAPNWPPYEGNWPLPAALAPPVTPAAAK